MGLETRQRVGWWHRDTRARQFKATSYGSDGISSCSGSESESESASASASGFVCGGGCGLLDDE